jgi:RNA polymerase-interacting CarD/CdnL/TRCF family regulator
MPTLEGTILDAAELTEGVRVVYPNQGVCAVVGVEVKEIAGQRLEMIRMRREEDGAAVLVPRGKVATIGLRRVASGELMEGVFHYLAATFDDPELDWKVRHRDNADRLVSGGVLGVAEVVKGLHALSRIRPLPGKEREQYDNARHLLVNEVSVSLGVPPGVAEDLVDHALMPPPGTTFKLKPPPKPVELPNRARRRRPVPTEAEEVDDLGLEDLDAVLGEVKEEGGEAAEGETADGEAAGETEEAGAIPTVVPAPRTGRREPPARPATPGPATAPKPARAPAAAGPAPARAAGKPAARPAAAKPGRASRAKPAPKAKAKARPAAARAPARKAAAKARPAARRGGKRS